MSRLLCLHGRRVSGRRAVLGAGGGLVASVVLACVSAGSASAAPLDLGLCDGSALSQPFLPWGDPSEYKLAPDGTFEAGGWTLDNGAQIVAGTDPLGSAASAPVLQLAPGASAQSGVSCVDAAYPTVRMFIGGSGAVSVSVVDGGVVLPAGVAVAGGGWQPTLPMPTSAAVAGAASGGTAEVSLLVTGVSGQPVIDDVYVDPWYRG
jgi:hypothetical protein